MPMNNLSAEDREEFYRKLKELEDKEYPPLWYYQLYLVEVKLLNGYCWAK